MGRVSLFTGVLILITLIKLANSACNATHPYTYNSACYQQCPWNNTIVTYLDISTSTCVQNCTGNTYAFDANKTCVSTCPSSPILTFYDKKYNRCVMNCTNNPITFADLSSRICVSSCAAPTYADELLGICVGNCSVDTYLMAFNITDRRCVKVCYPSYYANLSRVCVAATSCPSSPVSYYGDDSTGLCVKTCPSAKGTFADDQTRKCVYYCPLGTYAESVSRKCVSLCPVIPNYFGSNITRNCLLVCNEGQFADPKTRQCTLQCPAGLFGDYSTRTCVALCPKNQSTFADSITKLCVSICPADYYADSQTQKCVQAINCGKNTYGDPITQVCVEAKQCSLGLYADIGSGKCVLRCTSWGNPLNNFCSSSCPWNPPGQLYYKDSSTNLCVRVCPVEPRTYGDEVSRSCVQTCPTDYYSDPSTMLCVRACPQSFYANILTRQCLAECTRNSSTILYYSKIDLACVTDCPINYYADNTTLNCQLVCTNYTFGYYPTRKCLADCPDGWFGDNYTRKCVQSCPIVTNQYADPSTNLCVDQCPQTPDYYGQDLNDGNMTCVSACVIAGFFADPLTRLCVYNCDSSLGYYGDPSDGRCYPRCPTGYGNPLNSQCVSQCPKTPKMFFGDSMTKTCVLSCPAERYGDPINNICVVALSCPSGYYGDDVNGRCLAICSKLLKLYADPVVRKCVPACTFPYFADPNRQACVLNCTNNFYKDNSTLTCVKTCPSMPDLYGDPNSLYCEYNCTNKWFSYSAGTLRVCLQMCPTKPPMLADLQSYTCVSKCANNTYSFINNTFRGCLDYCPPQVYSANLQINLYADNTTWSCVVVCPYGYYAFANPNDDKIRLCVKMCPMVGTTYYYAEDSTRTCVTKCPLLYKFSYADSINFRCTTVCSRSQYKDNSTATCVDRCPNGTFANNQTWNCSKWCNQGYFAQTQNNTCVKVCPPYQYGYKKVCLVECPNNTLQYKQNTTWLCVSKCPSYPDYYADNNSVECVLKCPTDWYADSQTRTCVLPINCTEPTVADPVSGRCVIQCPMDPVHYLTIELNLCVEICLNGTFAFNQTNLCVDQCPAPYFGANTTNSTICVQYCPPLQYMWINHTTRRCVNQCPDGLFRDNLTMSCVTVCPDYSYANKSNNLCVLSCFPLYADDYTKSCVEICPNGTTASNNSFRCQQFCEFGNYTYQKVCYQTCPNGLFANNLTRSCLTNCSLVPLSYADPLNNKCIFNCTDTEYAFLQNRTCATTCPQGYYKQLTLKLCIRQCLQDYYADNDTQSCVLSCSASPYSFADPTFRVCVARCPQNPDLFGDNNKCLTQCPLGFYAQNVTRTCMSICPSKNSTFINQSWADDLTRRCLAKCSALSYSFSNITHNICLNSCPSGFYASIQKKSCLDQCPNGSYAHIPSKICVDQCPPGLWADLISRVCKSDCTFNSSLYADDSSGACVEKCPTYPDLYADTVAQKCVLTCPADTYAYNITRKCVSDCPAPYFADLYKLQCVLKCLIPEKTFADSYDRKCASGCQDRIINGTTVIYYEDNSTLRCVTQCPQYPAKLYGVNDTHICSQSCPSGTYGDNDTRVCLNTCVFESPKYTWKDKINNFCVTFCPYGYFADNFTNSCQRTCTTGTFADPSTRRCVINCPINPASYSITLSNVGVCVYNCPDGTYSSEVTISCVDACPTSPSMYYTYPPINACVKQCIYPYYADTNTRACTENCKVGFYGNKTLKTCQPCRIQCVTCAGYLVCTSCVEGFYLSDRSCVINCPSYPVLYFAHKQAGVCYQTCPQPFYGEASTGLCQLTCPSYSYPAASTRKCTSCPTGCVLCNQLGCSSCLTGYTFLPSALMCNQNCNQTAPYYFKTICYFTCPDGSYLTYDLVHCAACSWPCATCMGIAGNCTSCIESYYYLGQCLDACPNNFYVNQNYNCIACSSNPQKCALPPLSYTFFPFTANYLLQSYIIFNRAVSMSADEVQRTVQIKSNGVAIPPSKYKVSYFNTTTFLAVFDKSMSLNELALSFSFSPGSITDQFGNFLTTVTVNQTITISTGLTPSIAQASVSLASVISYVSFFALVLITILLIKNNYAALICLQFLQLLHLHSFLYWDILPYLQFTFLNNIRFFNLAFLPSFFTPLNITNKYYSEFTQDISYLNNSPILFIFVIVIAFYIITSILSSKKLIKNKHIRKTFKKIRKHRIKYGLIHDALWITYPYAMIISILQFKFGGFGSTKQIMNIVFSILTFVIANLAVLYITYLSHKYKKEPEKIPRKFRFLSYDPSNMTIEIPLRYFRKLLFVISFMLPSFQSQIVSLLAVNLAFVFYYLCHQPSKSSITNYACLFLELLMIILESLFYAYNRLQSKSTDSQLGFSLGMLSVEGIAIITIIVWLFYRLVLMIRETDSWKHIYAKITQNKDPEYLREQQRKRDLEFDFGGLDIRSQDEQTNHAFEKISSKNDLLEEKDNIFDRQERDSSPRDLEKDINLNQDKNKLSRHNSMESSQKIMIKSNSSGFFEPRKSAHNYRKRRHLQIQYKELNGSVQEVPVDKLQDQKQKNKETKEGKVLWEDIELDENQI